MYHLGSSGVEDLLGRVMFIEVTCQEQIAHTVEKVGCILVNTNELHATSTEVYQINQRFVI